MGFRDTINKKSDKEEWDNLVDEIILGNVIPIIGDDIIAKDYKQLNRYYIEKIYTDIINSENIPENVESFNDVLYSDAFLRWVEEQNYLQHKERKKEYSAEEWLRQVIEYICCEYGKDIEVSDVLKKIVSIKQFPFVITTSFSNIIELEMRKTWGKNLSVKVFDNSPSERYDDLRPENEIRIPTIYYMFGKADLNKRGFGYHNYSLTDSDMLDFCSAWIRNPPINLWSTLRSRRLLMIGNSYSDWLFRFIWYSLRKYRNNNQRNHSGGVIVNEKFPDSLERFLNRIENTVCRTDPESVIDRITEILKDKLTKGESKFKKVQSHTDIFISYSRRDFALANALYLELTNMGLNVWFDRDDIYEKQGNTSLEIGKAFMNEIFDAIQTTRLFIPIFSQNIIDEIQEAHPYRQEWKKAVEVQNSKGCTFIVPISPTEYNYKDAGIPRDICTLHAEVYNPVQNIEECVKKIASDIYYVYCKTFNSKTDE